MLGRFSLVNQKSAELGLDSRSLTDSQKITVYKDTLRAIDNLLLASDARKFTEASLDVFISDLTEIIRGIDAMRYTSSSDLLSSVEGIVSYLREARNELYVASDMADVRKNKSFYKCIDKARDGIMQAINLF